MAQAEVYYFSGTGNSLAVARALAGRLEGVAIPIASVIERETIEPAADVVGVTFPVYYADLPNIVRRFAGKLAGTEGRYVFGVATYGGAAGGSLRTLDRILRSQGPGLSAGFGVHMPQNAFRKRWENKQRVYDRAERRIAFVVRSVAALRNGTFYGNVAAQLAVTPFHGFLRRMTARYLEEVSNTPSPSGLAIEEMIPLVDRSFAVDERCNGCGTCAAVCPVSNVEIVDGRPIWRNRCENCLACVSWCPVGAVRGGIAAKSGYRYRHPDAGVADIAAQRRTAA